MYTFKHGRQTKDNICKIIKMNGGLEQWVRLYVAVCLILM